MFAQDGIRWTKLDRLACGKCGTALDVSELDPFSQMVCPSCGTEQTVPARFGTFLLVERLGSGGMGAVYRAMDPTLGRFVAIKVMKAEMGDDPALVESFLREARAAAALNHPNIVQIYSCGQEQGQPYIVMELVGGGRLDQLMEGGKKVDEVRLLEISLDVAEGLKAANEVGLVHGDIKPANILFDKSGRARIVDFGLAMFVNRQQEMGGIWGTPYYIAPERARGGKADHRSDIYSLGATMFHALAGRPPFDGKTAADVVVARLKRPPPNLRELAPSVQPQTAALIERMMAADPVNRYPTCASLLADMRSALASARAARSPTSIVSRNKKIDRSHLIVLGAAALILLLAAILFIRHSTRAAREAEKIARAAAEQRKQAATNQPARAQSQEQDESEGVEVTKTESGRVRIGVTVFTGEIETEIVRACEALADNPAKTFEDLGRIATNVPANSARMMWLRVLQAVPLWAQGQTSQAEDLLRQVAALPLTQRRGHPVYMPQQIAQYLIGDLGEDRFKQERKEWPAWFSDVAGFLNGIKLAYTGNVDQAILAFDAYTSTNRIDPAWAYAMRPAAQRWLETLKGWKQVERDTLSRAGAGDIDGARAALQAYLASAPAFMRGPAKRAEERIAAKEEEMRAELEARRERERLSVIQKDFDAIDAWLAEQTPLIMQQKDFRRVANAARDLAGRMQTEEGKAQAGIILEHAERLQQLRDILGRELRDAPYNRPDRELGGEAVGATALGLRVAVPGRGTILRPWEQVSPRLFVLLGRHLADSVPRSAEEKADLYLSLAIASAYFGAYEPASALFQQALETHPPIASAAHRLLPGSAPPAN
ncbi:MAG: serine/threonine protein kinase [Kiritimatiellae bacterium]|nr:serine/threonine protein kinase [Kiritimatiellia bacterium]MDW8457668.1 serine/threonine-protein kinase [Verrucomicrobiota bacterium]